MAEIIYHQKSSMAGYAYPNNFNLYAGYTLMPQDSVPAPVGCIPFVETTPGIAQWVPISEAIIDVTPTDIHIYVSPTGNDVTGTGTISAPFLTLPRCMEYISTTGYNSTALVTVVGNLPLSLSEPLNLRVGQKGEQTYPPVIQGQTPTVLASSTVSTTTQDAVTGLWTLITHDAIFSSGSVGDQVVFTSGVLSTYQPNAFLAATELSCMIAKYISTTSVLLAFGGAVLPTVGDGLELITASSALVVTNTSSSATLDLVFDDLVLNNITITIANDSGDVTSVTLNGGSLEISGVHWNTVLGSSVVSVECDLATTFTSLADGITTISNNYAGMFVGGTGLNSFDSSDSGDTITLLNSALAGSGSSSIEGALDFSSCVVEGLWMIESQTFSTLVNSLFDFLSTAGEIYNQSQYLTISDCTIQNSTSAGVSSTGITSVFGSALINNSTHLVAYDAGTIAVSSTALTTGAGCRQCLVAYGNGQIDVMGNLTLSTTVSGTGTTTAPIAIYNSGRIFVNGNLTLSSSPTSGAYVGQFGSLSCNNLSLNCSSLSSLDIEGGGAVNALAVTLGSTSGYSLYNINGTLNCTSLTAASTNSTCAYQDNISATNVTGTCSLTSTGSGAALTCSDGSTMVVGGAFSTSAGGVALDIHTSGQVTAGSISAVSTALSGSVVNSTGSASITSNGAVTITGAGDYGLSCSYGGTINAASLTVLGTTTQGIIVNNRGSIASGLTMIAANLDGISAVNAVITISSDLVCTLSSVSSYGVSLSGGSTLTCNNFTANNATTGFTVINSTLSCAALTVTGATYGAVLTNAVIETSGIVAIGASNTCLIVTANTQWDGSGTATLTGSGSANGITLATASNISQATLSIICPGTCIGGDSGFIVCGNTLTMTSTTGACVNVTATSIQSRNGMSMTQVTGSSMVGGVLNTGGLTVSSSAGAGLTLSGTNCAFDGAATITSTAGNSFTASTIKLVGALTVTQLALVSCTVLGGGTLTVNAIGTSDGLTSTDSSIDVPTLTCLAPSGTACTLFTSQLLCTNYTGTGSNLGLKASRGGNINVGNTINCNTCTNIGVSLANVTLIYGVALNCTGCPTGLSCSNSIVNGVAMSLINGTGAGLNSNESAINLTSTLDCSNTAVTGFNQLSMIGGSLTCSAIIANRAAGAGSAPLINFLRTIVNIISGNITMSNAGASGCVINQGTLIFFAGGFVSTALNSGVHVSVSDSQLVCGTSTIGGGGGSGGFSITAGSNAVLTGVTVDGTGATGDGIQVDTSRLIIGSSSISNWSGSGIHYVKGGTGALTGVTSTAGANGVYGVQCDQTTHISTNTSVVTGTSGDVKVGAVAAPTSWANIAGGLSANITDAGSVHPKDVWVVAF